MPAKADVYWRDKKGLSILQHAQAKGHAEIIEMLKKPARRNSP
jgi:hypothetical protein